MLARATQLPDLDAAVAAIKQIFFLTSSRTQFDSPAARETFFQQWTSYYLSQCLNDVLVSRDAQGNIVAYLTGCRDTPAAHRLLATFPWMRLFSPHYHAFPAHFHVNCHPGHQGRGIGRALVTQFCADCKAEGSAGVHLVSAATAANVPFYRRLGFVHEVTKTWNGRDLLLMGRPS